MELNTPPVHSNSKKRNRLYVECLDRVLTSGEIQALNLSELEKLSIELNDLNAQLSTRRYFYLSLDLPEYDERFVSLMKCNKKYGIVKQFLKKVDTERKLRLMESIGLSEEEKHYVVETLNQLERDKKYYRLRGRFVRLCDYVMKTIDDPKIFEDIFDAERDEDEVYMKYDFDYHADTI